jgi:hypothetical protein
MGEDKKFNFLSHPEFQTLSAKEMARYLVTAQQALEEHQRVLRQQVEILVRRTQ